jgi:outer membrane protein OmpA-like peptidoglycan-associated protein
LLDWQAEEQLRSNNMRGVILGVVGVSLVAAAVTAAAEPAQPKTEVFFEFDSSKLSREAKYELEQAAKESKAHPNAKIIIDGHTDPVGTSAYNVGLSIRRAEAARDHLICKGADPDNIVMAYYGEDGPQRATHAKDRRVSVELTNDPLYVVIDKALPEATALTWKEPATTAEIDGPRPTQMARR